MRPLSASRKSHVLGRRDVLQVGALGVCGLSLANVLQASGAPAPGSGRPRGRRHGRAKSCIVLFQQGGPAQHDTFDMKPDAPAEIRGEFKPIPTSVPGYLVCELMP